MKISVNWLKEFFPNQYSSDEIAEMLTSGGLEVEGIEISESIPGGLKGLVTGEILTCVKHPDADKLSLTTVNINQEENLQIVCGASNVAAGQKVIVATAGTKIFPLSGEPFVIKQAKIRGQLSEGMICAEDEIGLGNSHEGIIVLPENVKPGQPAAEYYSVQNDSILEIGLTPNRADAASHIGVARDLAAVSRARKFIDENKDDTTLKINIPAQPELNISGIAREIKVSVDQKAGCIRYSGITISDINIEESPSWLKGKLSSIGVKPINNVVDITNYILHESGQPLHAFDADKIKDNSVVVRKAKPDEKFTTLDGVERSMNPDDLMICDSKDAMCIAGVFGGINSGISPTTKTVFLESACFDPATIRKTGKRHGLKTDASFRFERGTDPEITIYALARAAFLICEIAGGKISSAVTDIYPALVKHPQIDFSFNYLDKFSGEKINHDLIKLILTSLGIKIISETPEKILLDIPLYKVDVTRPADVAEEILRIYGYDRIPLPEKLKSSLPVVISFDREKLQHKIASYLSSNGFNETLNNSLTRDYYADLPSWNRDEVVKILNPLSQELSVMRQDLLSSLLETVSYNKNRKQSDVRLFEFGKTYFRRDENYIEYSRLAFLLSGKQEGSSWKLKNTNADFFLLKAIVKNILDTAGINKYSESAGENKIFSSSVSVKKGDEIIIEYGALNKNILKKFDLTSDVFYADVSWDSILKYAQKKPVRYSEISKFPSVKRDLSMLIDKAVNYSQLEKIAFNTEKKILKDISLFDIYEGEKIESGKKSYALSFILENSQQTLTEDQINSTMEKLMAAFEKEAGAIIRSKS